jgi:purine-binding chemotaxis protein CheW
VAGIVNVRGRLLPVIDLKKFFDLPDEGLTDLHCVIVVRDRDVEFGVLADVIGSVRMIPVDSLEVALPTLTDIGAEFLKGVTPERLVVLDLARIFADPKIMVNEEVDD